MPWARRRTAAVVGTAVSCLIIVALFLPTVAGGWAPVLHWTCQRGARALDQRVYIPAQLLNAPYGGWVWGNVTLPPGMGIRGSDTELILGTSDMNGGVVWSGFEANVTVYSVANQTVWGPGANTRCTAAFAVEWVADGNVATGIPLVAPGSISNQGEPTVLHPGSSNIISFSNGFSDANAANITTCGGAAESFPPVISNHLTLWVSFAIAGQNHTVPFQLPLVESAFHYWFPADFGTWQVDDLSASGGPGGGWAFSYSPCS